MAIPTELRSTMAARRTLPLLLLLSGCAVQGRQSGTVAPQSRVTIVVESHNWTADAVRVMCEGRLLATVRDVAFNRTVTQRVHLSGCQDINFEIERLAAGGYAHPELVPVSDGDTVVLAIAATLPHTHLRRDRSGQEEH